ncbi:REX4, RNA exonuclease 4 [Agyrium rufum]|nr:REX4, RNA exonuclease 4 [Agyrium rufum]
MDTQNLSTNWKILQKRLQATNAQKKRAAPDSESQAPLIKRPKLLEGKERRIADKQNKIKQERKEKDMGAAASLPNALLKKATLTLWAEDNEISKQELKAAYGKDLQGSKSSITSLIATKHPNDVINAGLSPHVQAGKYLAIDCEMVGVGPKPDDESALARVSVVNFHGEQVYDSFVLPKERVTDYRTYVSGITPKLLEDARTLEEVQKDIASLLDGKILVGHAIRNDLDALMLGHPKRDIHDTSKHAPYRALSNGRSPGLKKLAKLLLGVDIQSGEHSSVEDARVTMMLFKRDKDEFEKLHMQRWGPSRNTGVELDGEATIKAARPVRKKKKGRK